MSHKPVRQVYTVAQACHALALSRSSLQRAKRLGKLQGFYRRNPDTKGRQLLFTRAELRRFMGSFPRTSVLPAPAATAPRAGGKFVAGAAAAGVSDDPTRLLRNPTELTPYYRHYSCPIAGTCNCLRTAK